MAENTEISWADHTWSPWYGCTQVSMGAQGACVGCYARQLSEIRQKRVIFGGPGRGEGTRDAKAESGWLEPLKWERAAAAEACFWDGVSPRHTEFIFPSMCDPFDNHPDLWSLRARFFDLIRATPHLTWLLLTKRPGNILRLFAGADYTGTPEALRASWPRNAAIGCTVVTQEEADRDIPKLLAAKAALNPAFAFVSMEPLLAPVRLDRLAHGDESELDALRGEIVFTPQHIAIPPKPAAAKLDWVITGGETDQGKHKARPSHPDWFRSLRDQCAAAGVPFHHKQNGEFAAVDRPGVWQRCITMWPSGCVERLPGDGVMSVSATLLERVGKKAAGRLLDGVTHDQRPEVRHAG